MKKEIHHLSLQEYFEKVTSQLFGEEQLLVIHWDGSLHKRNEDSSNYPMKIKTSSLILVLGGEMTIEVDYLSHSLGKNTILQLITDNVIEHITYTEDFRGYLIFFSPELKHEIISLTSGIRVPNANHMKRMYPKQELTGTECQSILARIERIKKYMIDDTHLYRYAIINNEVINLMLDIDNSRWKRHGETKMISSYNETIYQRFRELLLENCRKHRDVNFYAQKLCITADYLSKLVREYDGQSALKWISNAVITEAKILLRQPDYSIYQIALELNFPDQSTFGKFFKRNTGMTPVQYKANCHYTK